MKTLHLMGVSRRGRAVLAAATFTLTVALLLALGCAREESAARDDHDHHGGADEHAPRGPHGGRLFQERALQLELCIVEEDAPPMFVAYVYDTLGTQLAPGGANLQVTLDRFAGRRDVIRFSPAANHLRGNAVVREPHSFRAAIDLEYEGGRFQWTYEQVEYRVELSPDAVTRGGIVVGSAEPSHIDVRASAPGEVRLNGERMLVVRPRFPGVVAEMRKSLGDRVEAQETVAVIQSNESLTEYDIKAPMSGRVVARTGMAGASVDNESTLYTLADLSTVWVDFAIYPQHVGVIRRGQPVTVTAATHPELVAEAEVSYVGPLLEQDTRVSHGRVVLPNPRERWQPGLYVTVSAVVDHAEVDVAVPDAAIVRSRFGPAVFLAEGSTFELQPVVPGRTDGVTTEISEGLQAGASIVVRNAFLLKAELGRGEATHDH
jgi:cobalt-zinc-cadmium efflux system membrane fusion protein